MLRQLGRLLALACLSALALQLYFLARVALMIVVDPQSTSFQRSEAWRLATEQHRVDWHQQWVADERLSPQIKRAVIASEDAYFGVPEVKQGALGAATHLARLVPQHLMRTLYYTARTIPAAQLVQFGSVLEVVPRDDLDDAARKVAEEIAHIPDLVKERLGEKVIS